MKIICTYVAGVLMAAVGFLAVSAGIAAAAETYTVDSEHTYILFKVKHVNIGNSYGRFNGAVGRFTVDDAVSGNNFIEMTVNAADVDTDVDKRDGHIRGPDFLNAEKYKHISFKSTAINPVDENTFEVTGDLTLLGKTRSITVNVRQTGAGKDPWGNYRRGFETVFTINRSEWGMDFMLSGVSDAVELIVSVEGVRE